MSRSKAITPVGALVILALLALLFVSTGASARDLPTLGQLGSDTPDVIYSALRGSDRYDTAIRISQAMFPGTLPDGSGFCPRSGRDLPRGAVRVSLGRRLGRAGAAYLPHRPCQKRESRTAAAAAFSGVLHRA